MKEEILKDFFERHIKGTEEKAIVADQKMLLCRMTLAVSQTINIDQRMRSIYITTRCLKHLYDKKPAEEFLCLIDCLNKVARYPDKVFWNKKSKRGDFCLVKNIKGQNYLCSIELIHIYPSSFGAIKLGSSTFGATKEVIEIHITTAFRIRDEKYLGKYTLLWSWGDGNPHRSALDTPKGSTNAPQ